MLDKARRKFTRLQADLNTDRDTAWSAPLYCPLPEQGFEIIPLHFAFSDVIAVFIIRTVQSLNRGPRLWSMDCEAADFKTASGACDVSMKATLV